MLKQESFQGIYLHRDPVDFRKSIDGLAAIVEQEMGLDVFGPQLLTWHLNSLQLDMDLVFMRHENKKRCSESFA